MLTEDIVEALGRLRSLIPSSICQSLWLRRRPSVTGFVLRFLVDEVVDDGEEWAELFDA